MAVGANESLTIDVVVRDRGATRELHNVSTTAKDAGKSVETAFDRGSERAEKLTGVLGAAASKLAAVSKAAAGIFAVDVAARVLGFSSAMEVINKVADGAARAIRDMGKALLGIRTDHTVDQIKSLNEEVSKLRDQLAHTRDIVLPDGRRVPFSLGGINSPQSMLRALELISNAQKRVERVGDPRDRPGQPSILGGLGALTIQGAVNSRLQRPAKLSVAQELDALRAALDGLREDEELAAVAVRAHANAIKLARRSRSEILAGQALPFGIGQAVGLGAGAAGFAMRRDEILRGFAEDQVLERNRSNQANLSMLEEMNRRNAGASYNPRALGGGGSSVMQGFISGAINDLVVSFAEGVQNAATEMQKLVQFSSGAKSALAEMNKTLESGLGGQAVRGTFDSFHSFWMSAITDIRNADEAVKNLGRSLLAVIANQAATRLAAGATNFIFGSILPQANGGVWRGGINSFAQGGVAYGPQLAMIGDNKSRTEAIVPMPDGRSIPVEMRGSGGGTVNLTLNVASLDPRSAADVVLAQSRKIQDMIAAALSQNMGLRSAVRGAVA